jgi:hypothetical protein
MRLMGFFISKLLLIGNNNPVIDDNDAAATPTTDLPCNRSAKH